MNVREAIENHHSPGCKIAPCANERGRAYYFECSDFHCRRLQEFASDGHEHHRLAVEHLKRMKEIGLEKWKEEQPNVMFCLDWLF